MKEFEKKVRVAMMIDTWFPFCGGGQVHVKQLVEHLRLDYGYEMVIFHGFSDNILARIFWNLIVIFQVVIAHYKKPFDLIHAHAYSAGLSGKIISLILGIPIVFTVHGSNSLDIFSSPDLVKLIKPSLATKIKYLIERWLLTGINYHAVITVSKNFLNYDNVNKNIYIIPNGIDKKFISSNQYGKKNLANHKKISLLFVGRLEKIKGLDILLKSLKVIKTKIADFEMRIVGDGLEIKNFKQLVKKLNLDKQVIFLQELRGNRLRKEYLKADLFILPSLSEGQPLTILEAWACNLPVLATCVGHNSEMVLEKINGYLVKPGDVKQMAEKLEAAFLDKDNWQNMGKRGQKMVREKYLWENTADKTNQVYKKLLKY